MLLLTKIQIDVLCRAPFELRSFAFSLWTKAERCPNIPILQPRAPITIAKQFKWRFSYKNYQSVCILFCTNDWCSVWAVLFSLAATKRIYHHASLCSVNGIFNLLIFNFQLNCFKIFSFKIHWKLIIKNWLIPYQTQWGMVALFSFPPHTEMFPFCGFASSTNHHRKTIQMTISYKNLPICLCVVLHQ